MGWVRKFNGRARERISLIKSDGPSCLIYANVAVIDGGILVLDTSETIKRTQLPGPGVCNWPLRAMFGDGRARCPLCVWSPSEGREAGCRKGLERERAGHCPSLLETWGWSVSRPPHKSSLMFLPEMLYAVCPQFHSRKKEKKQPKED